MCNTSAQDGRYLLERVRSAVAATPVQLPAGAAVGLTVSVGAAQFLEGEELASLLERADEALYAAKRLGRNRVVWATR